MEYKGMDPTYFVGIHSLFDPNPAESCKDHNNQFDGSNSSGSSSNTTQLDQAEDGDLNMMAAAAHQAVMPLLDRPLPIRKRQRKPNRKTMQAEADSPAVTSTIRKRGRKPKAAGDKPKPTPAGNASEGENVATVPKRLEVKAPPNPPMLRELPRRNTPKKFWADEEVELGPWWGKRGGAAQAAAEEEEDNTDYSPSPTRMGKASGPKKRGGAAQAAAEEEEEYTDYSPSAARKGKAAGPKKSKPAQEGDTGHPNRKKAGGPCVICFATTSVTWRRGAQGRRHAGQPLCNKCGVWEFRHPDSPPRDFFDEAGLEAQLQQEEAQLQQEEGEQRVIRSGVSTRGASRRVTDPARAVSEEPLLRTHSRALPSQPLTHEEVTGSALAQDDKLQAVFRITASGTAATASRMQRWEGNSLVGSMTNAAHDSMMQPAAQFGPAHTANMVDDSILHQGAGVQRGKVGGAKRSRKRSTEENDVQPAAKRWQLDGSLTGGVSNKNNLWGIASAARELGVGRNGMEAAQAELGVAEGDMASHYNSVLNSAAMGQQYVRKDEWGYDIV